MSTQNHERYNVSFDPELIERIDAVAGRRGRSAFLALGAEELLSEMTTAQLRREVERRKALSRPPDLRTPIGQPPAAKPRTAKHAPVQQPRVDGSPGERIEVAKRARRDAPKRPHIAFDPSRFNQATSLR